MVLRKGTPTIKLDASPEERPGINMSLKECRTLITQRAFNLYPDFFTGLETLKLIIISHSN